MTIEWPEHPVAPLLTFAAQIGIPKEELRQGEGPAALTFNDEQLPVTPLKSLSLEQIRSLADAYGPALDCKVFLGGMPVLVFKPDLTEEEVQAFRKEVGLSPTVELNLKIDKYRLVEDWLGDVATCRPFLFLFPEKVVSLLQREPESLRAELWEESPGDKVLLLVPDRPVHLDGPYLAILGGDAIGNWQEVVANVAPDATTVKRMHDSCRDLVRWRDLSLGCLTPLHLDMEGELPPDADIAEALLVHRANLFMLYTADQVVLRDDGSLEATYAEANQKATVPFCNLGSSWGDDAWAAGGSLTELVRWTYDRSENRNWAEDRLPLVQVAVCQALRATRPQDRCSLLVRIAPDLLDELQWLWKDFVGQELEKYTTKVKDLEDHVEKAVTAYADEVSGMIDSLSKTMLAAVAAVLGSFIGAVLSDDFDAGIFAIGMLTYAAYVFLFPLLYNMIHVWGRYRFMKEGFAERRQRFEKRLYRDNVQAIVGKRVDQSEKRFVDWFWLTVLSYLLLVVAAVAATIVVPVLMVLGG